VERDPLARIVNALDAIFAALFGVDPDRAVPVFALVLARTMPLAFAAPWLGWKGTALFARVAVGGVLSVALTPIALASAPDLPAGFLSLAFLAVREVLIGLSFAIVSSLPLLAMEWTGELVDRWRADRPGPLGTLHIGAAVALFVVVGGHRLALAAFAQSFSETRLGAPSTASDLADFALGAGRIVTSGLELAVAFAAPAAISFLALEATLGLAGRAARELRIAAIGTPLRAALGVAVALFALSAALPRLPALYEGSIEAARALVSRLR
jgi:flagellar biosynthesis protein FliR